MVRSSRPVLRRPMSRYMVLHTACHTKSYIYASILPAPFHSYLTLSSHYPQIQELATKVTLFVLRPHSPIYHHRHLAMCIRLIERYAACRCVYHRHAVDPCRRSGQRGHPVEERTILVGYACPAHSPRRTDSFSISHELSNSSALRSQGNRL